MKRFQQFISQLFQDKNGSYSLREVVVLLFITAILVSWIARQFFRLDVPEFMFYSLVSLVGQVASAIRWKNAARPTTTNRKPNPF